MKEMMRLLFVVAVALMNSALTMSSYEGALQHDFYRETCPLAKDIIMRSVEIAVLKDPLMAAALLRLHFHDCFVLGCDASILLDSHGGIISEKEAVLNLNSIRGFHIIDEIKSLLEEACPLTVSCADILAIAARDAVFLTGGPRWNVWLGRRDSLKASLDGANLFIPSPNSSLLGLISNFKQHGLDIHDLVVLSGSHTIGTARCLSFQQRIDQVNPIELHGHDKYKRYDTFRKILRSICSGSDTNRTPLDFKTTTRFDNQYYINLLQGNGLLGSDNVLLSEDEEGEITKEVMGYASDKNLFFEAFVKSIVKMGNINVLTGIQGEIRKNCRLINYY